MDARIVAVYCLSADMLLALGHRNDPQCHLTDAEIMTIALVAALYFGGNYALACAFLHEQRYMARMLSPSRFSRRLHRIKDLFLTLFAFLGEHWKELNQDSVYIIDSFPIASCDNMRIKCLRRYQGEDYLKGFHLSHLVMCRDTVRPAALACNCASALSTRRPIERGCTASHGQPHHQSAGDTRA